MRRPPQCNQPRERTLEDGTILKWCGECGLWGNHLRANHPAIVNRGEVGNLAEAVLDNDDNIDAVVNGGVLAQLRAVGLA